MQQEAARFGLTTFLLHTNKIIDTTHLNMKTIHNIIAISTSALLLTSCDNDWNPEQLLAEDNNLNLTSLSLDVDNSISETLPTDLNVNDFNVSITNSETHESCGSWKYSEMPEVITLLVGNYKIDIENAPLQPAAWNAPYYYAGKSFSITADEIANLGSLTCSLSNIAVSVNYSDALKAALGNDAKVTVSTTAEASLDYVGNENRIGYFAPTGSETSLVASFNGTVNGIFTTLTKTFTGVSAGQHHYITFSVNNGSINPELIIDADITFDDVDINIPGTENPDQGEKPGEDNTPTITSQSIDLDNVNTITEDLIANVDIFVPNGIKNLEVTIISEGLSPEELLSVGLSDHFDLANPGELEEVLNELGFPTGNDVIGKEMLSFDISSFMPLLIYFPGSHNFKLDITDSKGLTATATLKFYTPEQ